MIFPYNQVLGRVPAVVLVCTAVTLTAAASDIALQHADQLAALERLQYFPHVPLATCQDIIQRDDAADLDLAVAAAATAAAEVLKVGDDVRGRKSSADVEPPCHLR